MRERQFLFRSCIPTKPSIPAVNNELAVTTSQKDGFIPATFSRTGPNVHSQYAQRLPQIFASQYIRYGPETGVGAK